MPDHRALLTPPGKPLVGVPLAYLRGLPEVSACALNLRAQKLGAYVRWRVHTEPCDYSPEEWLECWGPYPEAERYIQAKRYHGAQTRPVSINTTTNELVAVRWALALNERTESTHTIVGRETDRDVVYLVVRVAEGAVL